MVEYRDGAVLAQMGTPAHPLRPDLPQPFPCASAAAGPAVLSAPDLSAAGFAGVSLPAPGDGLRPDRRLQLRGAQRSQRGGGGAVFGGAHILWADSRAGGTCREHNSSDIKSLPGGYTGNRPAGQRNCLPSVPHRTAKQFVGRKRSSYVYYPCHPPLWHPDCRS